MQSALLVVAIGGGDAKIPATALIGYRELIDFPFLMSLFRRSARAQDWNGDISSRS